MPVRAKVTESRKSTASTRSLRFKKPEIEKNEPDLQKSKILGKRKLDSKVSKIDQVKGKCEPRSSKRSRIVTQPYQSTTTTSTSTFIKTDKKIKPIKRLVKPPLSTQVVAKKSKVTKVKKGSKVILNKGKIKLQINAKTDEKKSKKSAKIKKSGKKNVKIGEIEKVQDSKKVVKVVKLSKKKGENVSPRPNLTRYEKDPTFESNLALPQISTLVDSRLLIRAVELGDRKLLEKLLQNKKICSLTVPRCLSDSSTAYDYAMLSGNSWACTFLKGISGKNLEKLGEPPEILVQDESSGSGGGNYRMFGHALANVTIGRGGKEGNAALLKDRHHYQNDYIDSRVKFYLKQNIPYEFIQKLIESKDPDDDYTNAYLLEVKWAVRSGHLGLAAKLIGKALKLDGYGFNFLHQEVLEKTQVSHLSPFKPVSVVKKAHAQNSRLTPLHCAAINPNPEILSKLLRSRPEYNLCDSDNWSLVHYAAACDGDGPLKLLISRGISVNCLTKKGQLPIHIASKCGRVENVILLSKKQEIDEIDEDPDEGQSRAKSSVKIVEPVDMPNRKGLLPIHLAAKYGHLTLLQYLIGVTGDLNKCTPAKVDKCTPLMLACQRGHLDCVQVLVQSGAKVEIGDRRKRTALVHAVLNGHGHIVSWLLIYGANHLTKDSSGNTLVHYAAAYGWYFILKLLFEAECPPNPTNDWKMTPLAIAFLKGHQGIVEILLEHKEADINAHINDTTGMTLLLQTCHSSPGENTLNRLKFLLDKKDSIDCCKTDYEGNNALYFIVDREGQLMKKIEEYQVNSCFYKDKIDKLEKNRKYFYGAAQLVMARGCSPLAKNSKGISALTNASRTGCYKLMEIFIESGITLEIDENGDTLLHQLASQILKPGALKFFKNLIKSSENIKILTSMSQTINKRGQNPLHIFLETYSKLQNLAGKELDDLKFFFNFLLHKLGINVNIPIKVKNIEENTVKNGDFPIHTSCAFNSTSNDFLQLVLSQTLDVNCPNSCGDSALRSCIKNGWYNSAKILIKNPKIDLNFKSKNEDLSLLYLLCDAGELDLFPQMIRSGADFTIKCDKTGNLPIHILCTKPKVKGSYDCLSVLLKSGCNVNAQNDQKRSPLHLLCNSRGGETDVSYDLEELLISQGGKLNLRDIRGRLPIHYIFCKISRPFESSPVDPIELVALLCDNMKEKGQLGEILKCDEFSATILHYSAARGAIISMSLLIEILTSEGFDLKQMINAQDSNGNTPLGLAVHYNHNGLALYLQQKGADFLTQLNKNISITLDDKEKAKLKEISQNERTWVWDLTRLKQQDKEMKIIESKKYPILQEIVQKDWQGLLYLMLDALRQSSKGIGLAIEASLSVGRFQLASKLIDRTKYPQDLVLVPNDKNLLHILAKSKENSSKLSQDQKLLERIVNTLISQGICPRSGDLNNSSAILYAISNHQFKLTQLLTVGLSYRELAKLAKDQYGRDTFSALFWNFDGNWITSHGTSSSTNGNNSGFKNFAENLIENGLNPNVNVKYPIKFTNFPLNSVVYNDSYNSRNFEEMSPLSMTICAGNYEVCKWILGIKSVDINFGDLEGRTPLMHAIRLNDIKMIKLLLNPSSNYTPDKDKNPWDPKSPFFGKISGTKKVQLDAQDCKGWSLVHHALCPLWPSKIIYENSLKILDILSKIGAPFDLKASNGQTPLDFAVKELKNSQVVKKLTSIIGQNSSRKVGKMNETTFEVETSEEMEIVDDFTKKVDYKIDSKIMTSKLIEENDAKQKLLEAESGRDFALEELLNPRNTHVDGKLKLIFDQENNRPYEAFLTQVDISYGVYGINNYYYMQLLEEPGKDLNFLFTEWGRLGDYSSQHQKTPYPTRQEALDEFCKVFKAKSGNLWSDYDNFTPLPKKYRLQKSSRKSGLTKSKISSISLDFKKLESSAQNLSTTLPKNISNLMHLLVFAHKKDHDKKSKKSSGYSDEEFLYDEESLLKGEEILVQIENLLKLKEKLTEKKVENNDEFLKVCESLCDLSTEFYSLVPMGEYAREKIKPIQDLRPIQQKLYDLLHIDFAQKLLLAALHRCSHNPLNPLDYIYSSIGSKLAILDESSEESQIILQYIETNGQNVKIQNIFKIQRPGEVEKSTKLGLGNKWLLWHGTKYQNILSILHHGLQVVPLNAQMSGDLFGKGIYFADMFGKSRNYCDSEPSRLKSKFMFLAEVSLGKIQNVKLSYNSHSKNKLNLEPGASTLKTSDSQWIPDPNGNIIMDERHIPLGKKIENILPPNEYHGLQFNEYIVKDPDQVVLRYLVQFNDNLMTI